MELVFFLILALTLSCLWLIFAKIGLERKLKACQDLCLYLKETSFPVTEEIEKLAKKASPWVEKMSKVEGRTGANRRHYVYKSLLKENPEADKRDVSVAIELAVRRS